MVTVDNGVNIDFMNADREIAQQHYAFLVSESDFDESSVESASERFPIGPIPRKSNEVRSARCLFRGSQWPSPRGHNPPLRQRRLGSLTGRPPADRPVYFRSARTNSDADRRVLCPSSSRHSVFGIRFWAMYQSLSGMRVAETAG
jgi:hypothetical protein